MEGTKNKSWAIEVNDIWKLLFIIIDIDGVHFRTGV